MLTGEAVGSPIATDGRGIGAKFNFVDHPGTRMSTKSSHADQPTGRNDESSDSTVMDLLRRSSGMSIQQLASAMTVTATAIRQRLNRMMDQGLVQRFSENAGRGRPSHRYQLTDKGVRQTGSNFADLATVLWQEIRTIQHDDVRRGLLQRLSQRLAAEYSDQITGDTTEKRMRELACFWPTGISHSMCRLGIIGYPYSGRSVVLILNWLKKTARSARWNA